MMQITDNKKMQTKYNPINGNNLVKWWWKQRGENNELYAEAYKIQMVSYLMLIHKCFIYILESRSKQWK